MGADGMYPSHHYPNDNMGFNRPYYNQGGHFPPGHMPSYSYPPNYGIGYGRGFQQPYPPMNNYAPMMNGFQQHYPPMNNYGPVMHGFQPGVFPNQIGGRGFFDVSRTGGGGLQSAPPFTTLNGNIQLNRPGEHRPHFDQQ